MQTRHIDDTLSERADDGFPGDSSYVIVPMMVFKRYHG